MIEMLARLHTDIVALKNLLKLFPKRNNHIQFTEMVLYSLALGLINTHHI